MKKILALAFLWLVFAAPTFAQNVNIDGLIAATSVAGTDLYECEQSGVNHKCTPVQLSAFIFGTVSGDLTCAPGGSCTLTTVNSNVGTFGSSTNCPTLTVNAKGLITAASQTACAGGGGGVTPTGTFTLGDMMIASGGSSIQDSLAFGAVNGGMSFSGGSVPAFASCYFNDIQTCVTENARLRERVFIGNAVLMNDTSATGPNGTFLSSALVGPNFIARGAQALSMSDVGGIAIAGMTEMANLLGGQSTVGGAFSCLANGAAGTCQAKYSEAQFNPNTITGSAAIGDENDCKNASSANNASDPFASPPGCRGYWAAAGGGKGYGPGLNTNATTATSSAVISAAAVPAFVTAGQLAFDNTTNTAIGTVASATTTTVTLAANTPVAIGTGDYITFTFPSDAAYNVVANQNVWRAGFNVQNGSQAPDGNGNFNTFQMPLQSSLYWYSAAATIADTIRGDAVNGLFFKGTGSTNDLVWENKNGTVVAQIPTGSSNFNVAPVGSAAAPSLTVGNLTTGFFSVGTTGWGLAVNGVTQFDFGIHAGARLTATPTMEGANAAGWLLNSNGASSTVPTVIPNQASTTTGIGAIASGEISEIVAGVDMGDWTSTGLALSHVPTAPTATVGTNTTQIATTAFVLANAGSGAVSSVSGSIGVTVTPTTGSVVVSTPATTRANTATTDTITNADRGTIVSENNASSVAAAITTTGFVSTDYFTIKNIGAGVATYTPSSGTIDGSATLVCQQNQSADLYFDGTNYHALAKTCGLGALATVTPGTNVATAAAVALSGAGGLTSTIFHGTATLGTSAIASGTCATAVNVTAAGVATTDAVTAGFAADPTATTGFLPTAMLTIVPYVASAGNIGVKVCNLTAASITPSALTINVATVR